MLGPRSGERPPRKGGTRHRWPVSERRFTTSSGLELAARRRRRADSPSGVSPLLLALRHACCHAAFVPLPPRRHDDDRLRREVCAPSFKLLAEGRGPGVAVLVTVIGPSMSLSAGIPSTEAPPLRSARRLQSATCEGYSGPRPHELFCELAVSNRDTRKSCGPSKRTARCSRRRHRCHGTRP
ncbi:hypothetical protein DMC30DRAFT_212289 [Rhodotorula diobovata]|uniref:Uncharacterized protein n=1 Tax=Rhodotorula diobovata TaxID=5288 RepID=A0A5C5FYC6_9BASI|nr:hypothetical protein DMC30DRAFT_212289 [Rhodotorula diobovata]